MTSPNDPPKESLRDRISTRFSTDKSGRLIDADAQHTRNVSWIFYGIIVLIVVVIVGGLLFSFYESNLKPLANVGGTDITRDDLEKRKEFLNFRADRADSQTSTALAEGTIDSDLANTRFGLAAALRPTTDAAVATDLVDLLYKEQLATDEGVELSAEELETAVAADGTAPEARRVEAIFVLSPEQEQGEASTDEGIADARSRAHSLIEDLEAGGEPEELSETYAPATFDSAWVTADADIGNPAWSEAIFGGAEGEVADLIEGPGGEQLIALISQVVAEQPDPGFAEAVAEAVGEDTHRRAVELESIRDKLEEQVIDEALSAEYEQVLLGEIFIERGSSTADDTAGEARASHILYQPETPLDDEGEPTELADLADDDPAWDSAEAEAQAAADELAAVEDADERMTAFAERAGTDSDGPTAARGGDLGWFSREAMVSEFSDVIWDNVDPQQGDVLGPVRSEFGWHVILFDQFRSSLDVRVADVEAALAEENADFDAVAAEYSDDPDAANGGESRWRRLDQLDETLVIELSAMVEGEMTEPIDEGAGYYIYQKLDEGTRPLEAEDAAVVAQSAFDDWYSERYAEAQDDGRISIDGSVYDQ